MSYMHFDFKPIDPRRASCRFDAGEPIETAEADGLAAGLVSPSTEGPGASNSHAAASARLRCLKRLSNAGRAVYGALMRFSVFGRKDGGGD